MLNAVLPHASAFAAALVALVVIRFAAGPERGPRLAGVGAGLGLMVGLTLIPDFNWSGAGDANRIGHIVLGAVLIAAALAWLRPGRWVQIGALAVFALGCAWSSVLGQLVPDAAPSLTEMGFIVVLAVLWLGLMMRFNALSAHPATSLVVAIAVAAGLAWLAAITHDMTVKLAGLCLITALFALTLAVVAFKVELSIAALIPLGAAVVAVAWALGQRQPETLIGLPILALVLFAERTARRIPMPAGGISSYLYLLALAACCAVPIVIAAVLVSAGTSP